MFQKKSHFKVFAMVSTYPSTIIMDRNTMMNLGVVIGHVTIYMRVVMVFGHALTVKMKIIVVEQYVLRKRIHVYLLTIIR